MAVAGIKVQVYYIFYFVLCALHYTAYQIKTHVMVRSQNFESQGHWQYVMQLQSFIDGHNCDRR